MNLLRMLALCAATATAVVSAADQVLVLSAQKQLLHATPSATASAGFSSAGLAELAMDALGLGSGTVTSTAPTRSPLQADIFKTADAYALVFVQHDGVVLDAIAASTTFSAESYHSVFPVTQRHGASRKVPEVIASEFATAFGAQGTVQCAGSAAICSAKSLESTVAADAALVQRVLDANKFLHGKVDADVQFARELADVRQLTASLSSADAKRALYVVGFSSVEALDSSKRIDARRALAEQVGEFLSALQKTHSAAGAQVVAAREAAPPSSRAQLTALTQLNDATSYSRLLASLATEPASSSADDEDDSGSDDDDDESDDDVSLAANATRSGNATSSAEKVSLEQIAEYQIVLWTSVLLATTLLLVILAMCNMNTGRDSLLYAKFITDANHRKAD